ncbi:MAG: transketolase [Acidobacteria bacterium]|nr:transketolase [Acidobacteriota bacterium]
MAKKPYAYAQLEAVALEMRKNKDMVFFYEYETPVATSPTGEVLNLVKEFGTLRTSGRGWAIDETWLVGAAVGVAAAGSIAVVRLPSMTTLFAIEYIYNQAGKLRSMTGGQASMPFVLWQGAGGRTRGSAGQHTEVGQEGLYANLPGVKVVVPSNAYDAKGLMIASIRDPDPVIYFDYPEVKSGEQPDVPDEAYEVPIGKGVVRQPGKDITLVAWAPATVEVKRALPLIAKAGISVEYIDPRTLKPLDTGLLAASVKKTRRLLVVEHGHYTNSYGSHVITEVVQAVPGVRAKKLAFPDVPGPGAAGMMSWLRPDAPKIVDAAVQMMRA